MSTTVHVKDISKDTSEKEIRDFFSFCGKISNLSVTPTSDGDKATQSATVTFEKETAAKTALLLDNTQLGSAQVHVSSAASLDQLSGQTAGAGDSGGQAIGKDEDIAQEDKPRSRILAEYLAHGYIISDKAIERALALDQQHGITARFAAALRDFDTRFHATERAQKVDAKYSVTGRAADAWRGMSSYFDKAMDTPTGQKLRSFYDAGNKQVLDVHNEARHLANLKSSKQGTGSGLHTVQGTDRTQCNCGADSENCPCEPGKCACNNCGKNPEVPTAA